MKAAVYQRRKENGKARASYIKRQYGLTPDEHWALLEYQQHKCALGCGKDVGLNSAVDHNHITGRVRGILCHPHNTALGAFGDDPAKIALAIRYLEGAR